MAVEKKWLAVSARSFTSNGTQFGLVTVADTSGFRVKQHVFIAADTLPLLEAQVKRVISATQLVVGPINNKVDPSDWINISAYTVVLNASIASIEQDKRVIIPDKDHYQAVYEADPVVADRVILVDQYGRFYGTSNPLPTVRVDSGGNEIADSNPLIKLGTNLLAIMVNSDIDSSQFIVDNDNFFIYDNGGNFIKEG